jgi:cobalt-zinc-cadmium efflux system membrane fusion protein
MPDGQITGIIPPLSEDSPIAVAIVDLENKAEAGAGQVRNVSILLENLPVKLAVEKEAIQTLDNKPHLFIKNDKGLVKREVSLGSRDDSFVEITAGLEENEIYTSKNSFILKADLGKEDVEDDD